MQSGSVYRNKIFVGTISVDDEGIYTFRYNKDYLNNITSKPISVNLPLQEEKFVSDHLFAFFYNILAEGSLKDIQCEQYRIDRNDDFSRLLKTTKDNTIGSITVEENK
jgi:serine/threonine-protein kinase HipA